MFQFKLDLHFVLRINFPLAVFMANCFTFTARRTSYAKLSVSQSVRPSACNGKVPQS